MTLRQLAVPVIHPAVDRLRSHWRPALAVLAVGILALTLLGPVRAFRAAGATPALALPSIPSAGPALMWTKEARGPSETQQVALDGLLEVLYVLGWIGFGVATVSIFASRASEAPERAGDTAVRRAVGASRRRLVYSMLVETALLAVIAMVIGLAFGAMLLSAARQWWPGTMGALASVGPGAALALSAVLGAAGLGSLGLFRARTMVEPPSEEVSLKVPAYQVSIAVALLMGAAALLAGPERREGAAAGDLATGDLFRVDTRSREAATRAAGYAALLDAASTGGEASTASLTSAGFLLGLGTTDIATTECGICYFGLIQIRWPTLRVLAHAVSADSFRARGIALLSGRAFTDADTMSGPRVAIVNRHLAGRYFQGGAAVGRAIYLGSEWPKTPYTVVGIVDDARAEAIGGSDQPRETVYLSVLQRPPDHAELLLNRTTRPIADLRRALGAGGDLSRLGSPSHQVEVQTAATRWIGGSFAMAASIILVMALIGTATTARMWADAQAWEVALRRAVGASRWRMSWYLVRRTATIGLFGGAMGLFLYSTVVAPALARLLPGLDAGRAAHSGAAGAAVILALVIGAIPALALLRKPPGTVLH